MRLDNLFLIDRDHPYKWLYRGPAGLSWGAYGLFLWLKASFNSRGEPLHLERIIYESNALDAYCELERHLKELILKGLLLEKEQK